MSLIHSFPQESEERNECPGMKLSRGPMTGVRTGIRQTNTILMATLLSICHSAQNASSKGLFPSLSPAQVTILTMAKESILPLLLSTNTLALLWTLSPIWPCLSQWPLSNFLNLLRCNHKGVLTKSMQPTGMQDWRPGRPSKKRPIQRACLRAGKLCCPQRSAEGKGVWMILIGATMKRWTGRTTVQNRGGGVEARKTGIGRDRGRGGERELLRKSEKEGESIFLAVTANRRKYLDLCSLPTPLDAISPGSISPQSPKVCSKSLQSNNSMIA